MHGLIGRMIIIPCIMVFMIEAQLEPSLVKDQKGPELTKNLAIKTKKELKPGYAVATKKTVKETKKQGAGETKKTVAPSKPVSGKAVIKGKKPQQPGVKTVAKKAQEVAAPQAEAPVPQTKELMPPGTETEPGELSPEQKAAEEELKAIDTMDLDQGEGNWLKKDYGGNALKKNMENAELFLKKFSICA